MLAAGHKPLPVLHHRPPLAPQRGFSYVLLLFVVALSGVLLAGLGQVWSTASRREKEAELLFVGEEYRHAIKRYFDAAADGSPKQYPQTLDELLLDHRLQHVQRYLRKPYADPLTGKFEWGLLREQGRIIGVYSLTADKRTPLKQSGFASKQEEFAGAKTYAEWRFIAR